MSTLDELRQLSKDELIQRIVGYKEELEEAEEFRASSSEIEKILDAELEAAKREAKEKDRKLQLTELELHRLQERSATEKREAIKVEDALRKELRSVKEELDASKSRIRLLEQKNDDLERADRNNQQEMNDLLAKLNGAIEKTSLMEYEVAEKHAAKEEVFRLREELKERPRLVVEPLRIERSDETPDEPTPGKERPEPMDVDHSESDQKSNNNEVTPRQGSKSFANSVTRIISELMVKVESLEGLMSRQKKTSPRA